MMKQIKVLIVDDSELIRAILRDILENDPAIIVVGVAVDPYDAREKIKLLTPDVLTLDIEMPKMNGISFLRNLMRLHPLPVVMISTLTEEGAPSTLQALELGAVDFLAKPKVNSPLAFHEYADELCEKVKVASQANLSSFRLAPDIPEVPVINQYEVFNFRKNFLVAIGASTGGTEAIKEVIKDLPENFPPVVIVQHIPPSFSRTFAERMDRSSNMKVQEASDGMEIHHGNVYIAPGGRQFRIIREGTRLRCRIFDGDKVSGHRPSVDVLFKSVAETMGKNVLSVILTGMGADGANGLLMLREQGAVTVAQDKNTCVVWGMPRAAVGMGAAMYQIQLSKICPFLIKNAVKTSRTSLDNSL